MILPISTAHDGEGNVIRREELERLADTTVEFRAFDGTDALIEQRPATPQEVATYEQAEMNATIAELRAQAEKAIAKNKNYAQLDPPTAAQQTKQIEELTKQMNGVIRQVIGFYDDIDAAELEP